MGAVSLLDDQKSLVILVDNEHWCQLFYRSAQPRRLLPALPKTRKATGHPTRGLLKHRHGPAPPVASGVSYVADAPGRARSTRVSPTRERRGVISNTGQLYGPGRSRSSVGAAAAL